MPTAKVRPATTEDARVVFDLTYEARKIAYNSLIPPAGMAFLDEHHLSQENFLRWRKYFTGYLSNNRYRVGIAELSGKVTGWYCLRKDKDTDTLMYLFVMPLHQGSGLGSLLLNDALLHDTPSHTICLSVLADNSSAIDFYKKHGFKPGNESKQTFYGAKKIRLCKKRS